jgi:hypothetical protein
MSSSAQKSRSNRTSVNRRLSLHGLPIEIECASADLDPSIGRLLGCFAVSDFADESAATRGSIVPYVGADVARRLPSDATPLHGPGDLTELYVQGERAWMFDERWGMSEINILKGQWKSWILPQPRLDPIRVTEMAVLRPLAMLLKNRGIHLLPAAAAARDQFAVLAISPFGLERELSALLTSRYRIIGQRWTALSEQNGRLALLGMPGVVQQRSAGTSGAGAWIDLTASNPLSSQPRAICSAVVIIDAGRRPRASISPWSIEDASTVLRLAWPLPELHPSRRRVQFASRVAQLCPCHRVQLSHDPREWLSLLESLRSASPVRKAA